MQFMAGCTLAIRYFVNNFVRLVICYDVMAGVWLSPVPEIMAGSDREQSFLIAFFRTTTTFVSAVGHDNCTTATTLEAARSANGVDA